MCEQRALPIIHLLFVAYPSTAEAERDARLGSVIAGEVRTPRKDETPVEAMPGTLAETLSSSVSRVLDGCRARQSSIEGASVVEDEDSAAGITWRHTLASISRGAGWGNYSRRWDVPLCFRVASSYTSSSLPSFDGDCLPDSVSQSPALWLLGVAKTEAANGLFNELCIRALKAHVRTRPLARLADFLRSERPGE